MEYLSKLPAEIPPGRILVHNHVQPSRNLGSRGFRAWLGQPGAWTEACGCGWAPELGTHYLSRQLGRAWPYPAPGG